MIEHLSDDSDVTWCHGRGSRLRAGPLALLILSCIIRICQLYADSGMDIDKVNIAGIVGEFIGM